MNHVAPLIVIAASLVAALLMAFQGQIVGTTELCLLTLCGVVELRQTVIHDCEMRKSKRNDALVVRHFRHLFETQGNALVRTGHTRRRLILEVEEGTTPGGAGTVHKAVSAA
jgi:hypothetical protein